MTPTGKIVSFKTHLGWGFIAPDAGGPDIFVHAEGIKSTTLPASGDAVTYEVVNSGRPDGKVKAVNVRRVGDVRRGSPASPSSITERVAARYDE